jgi:hypothetical protein
MNASSDKVSSILLLCMGSNQKESLISNVKIVDLVEIFDPFGSLKKIMIFSKSKLVKAFVEFGNIEVAKLAKETLSGTHVNNFGMLNLFFSDLKEISCKNNFLDFWDGENNICKEGLTISTREELPKKSLCSLTDIKFTLNFDQSDNFNDIPKNSLNLSCPLENIENQIIKDHNKKSFRRCSLDKKPRHFVFSPDENPSLTGQSNVIEMSGLTSKVILASNLENYFMSAHEVFNLFSCFGDICKILLMKNLHKALVEFTAIDGALKCFENINKRPADSFPVRVSYSKYKKIDLKKSQKNEFSQKFNEVLLVAHSTHRFASGKSKFCPPSQSIIISMSKHKEEDSLEKCLLAKEALLQLGVNTLKEKIDYSDQKFIIITCRLRNLAQGMLAITRLHRSLIKSSEISVSFKG